MIGFDQVSKSSFSGSRTLHVDIVPAGMFHLKPANPFWIA